MEGLYTVVLVLTHHLTRRMLDSDPCRRVVQSHTCWRIVNPQSSRIDNIHLSQRWSSISVLSNPVDLIFPSSVDIIPINAKLLTKIINLFLILSDKHLQLRYFHILLHHSLIILINQCIYLRLIHLLNLHRIY